MASPDPLTSDEIAAAMQEEDMQTLLRYLVPRTLRTIDYDALSVVAAALPKNPHLLKQSLFYLEAAQWSLRDALFHIELDTADRQDSWIVEDNEGYPATLQHHNLDFKRDLAESGDAFDPSMFEITYKTGTTTSATVAFPDQARRNFDKDNQDSVDDLNRWRRSKTWHLIGPEKGMAHSSGEKWHPLQETYIRNRFALPSSSKPDFKGIQQDYLDVFVGVLLPGRVVPCGNRTQTAITSYLHREVIDNVDGVPLPRSLTRDLKHDIAKSRLQEEWRALVAEAAGI